MKLVIFSGDVDSNACLALQFGADEILCGIHQDDDGNIYPVITTNL